MPTHGVQYIPITHLSFASGASPHPWQAPVKINWLARHIPDTEGQREYAQERCVVAVTEALGEAIENAGLNQSGLAERLGKSPSYVSRVLNGAHNMTLRTLGDMLWACSLEMQDLELAPLGVIEVAPGDAIEWRDYTEDLRSRSAMGAGTIWTCTLMCLTSASPAYQETNLLS